LGKYYTKENNLFLNYKHFGMSFEEISLKVKEFGPDVVCINMMFTTYSAEALLTAGAVKAACPDCVVIAGGYHSTVAPESVINSKFIDVVVRGEGETFLKDLFVSKGHDGLKEIKKTILDNNGAPFIVDKLDELPFPDRSLVDPLKYTFNKKPYTMILTSRGCPNDCVFCSVHAVAGHSYRTRDIKNVLDEIDECYNKHGIEAFDLQDDNLLFDPERIKTLLSKIISKYGTKKLEILATNGLNVSNMDEEMLVLMKEAGFKKLDVSLATGDVSSREGLKRPETIAQYENILDKANAHGLDVTTYIILGLPEQPLEEIKETVNYLMGKNTLISPSVFYNVPGMPIYEDMKKYEYINSAIARRSTAFNSRGKDFDRKDIFRIFKKIRVNNLTKLAKNPVTG
jgi:anaerobic magnesium-protoporphyrin IX monomethyl ester cyclase